MNLLNMKFKMKFKKSLALMMALLLLVFSFAGCGAEDGSQSYEDNQIVSEMSETESGEDWEDFSEIEIQETEAEIAAETEVSEAGEAEGEEEVQEAEAEELYLDPDGVYNSKEDVALYLYLYGVLPSNYLTKKEAQKLGWSGGSLEKYVENGCIGGSYFGNNEGILPEGSYHECDIDTLGQSKRGAKRIVYSDDGNIYYTEDHYETFTLLYTADGPVTEEIVYGD